MAFEDFRVNGSGGGSAPTGLAAIVEMLRQQEEERKLYQQMAQAQDIASRAQDFMKGFHVDPNAEQAGMANQYPESVFTGSAGLKAVALANFPPLAPGQTRAVRRRHREKTAAEAHYSGL